MPTSRSQREGLAVDPKTRTPCPFLSAFAGLYVPSMTAITTRDLHTEYKHYVSTITSDVRLIHISESFSRFGLQFAVVAIHMKFVKHSSGYKGYLVRRIGRNIHRAEGISPPIFGLPLDCDLRRYSTRLSVLDRRNKADQTSSPILVPVSTQIGKGVFATHDYAPGQEVCECVGEMIAREEAEVRQVEYESLGLSYRLIEFETGYGSSLCCLDCHRNADGNRIDPDSNLGGNINHSSQPNCKLVKSERDGQTRFMVVTTTAVCEGAEFLLKYSKYKPGAPTFIRDS